MTTPTNEIKKALRKAFPETKFACKTYGQTTEVKWDMGLGCPVTVDAVEAEIKKFETITHFGDSQYDTAWSTGYRIECRPNFSDERKEWAKQSVNFACASWSDRSGGFVDEKNLPHYWANQEYKHYLNNGVCDNLVNEYGNEPNDKYWYYENIKKNEAKEDEQVSEEVEVVETEEEQNNEIKPESIIEIKQDIFIDAKFPKLNKNNWIEDYLKQPDNECNFLKAKIVKIVELTPKDYDHFLHTLIEYDHEWIDGCGGTDSHYQSKYGDDWQKLFSDPDEKEKWIAQSYNICALVSAGDGYVLVDTQGYKYARYVGFGINKTLDDVLDIVDGLETNPTQNISEPETTEDEEVVDKISPNFFTWDATSNLEQVRKTQRLILALDLYYKVKLISIYGQGKNAVMIFSLKNPKKIWGNFQDVWYKVWYNGGEVNVEKVNSTEMIESVCSTCETAETVAYRLYKTMTGEGFDHKTKLPSLESIYRTTN